MDRPTIIIICGPTAVGKTAIALKLAEILETEIISADSRQCFKELNIGVAKPTEIELKTIHHYFINSHNICDEVNAGVFETYALQAAEAIFQKHPVAVMVGGTGLYIKAFCEGLDEMPIVDPIIRQEVMELFKQNGLGSLQEQLAIKDPAFWNVAERDNPQRLMRALEVVLSSGKSITTFRKGKKQERSFEVIKVGLELPRPQLYQQINVRVDDMIEQGLVEEARALWHHRKENALQTVGYKELFEYFDSLISLEKAIEDIKINTRHYAKRQLTWFKKDKDISWFNPSNHDLLQLLLEKVHRRM
ncbi:MAG: tRNA (adenosine(37)-N6)-dimethylallyltransferase MiaA [Segetibacter sp.]